MSYLGALSSENHFAWLQKAYNEVGNRTWKTEDFRGVNLETSRGLFTSESLAARRPRPKELEVFALLAGLTFGGDFTEKLVDVQQRISAVLGDRLHYLVASSNLGVEFCVFKWPTDTWREEWLCLIRESLAAIRQPSFGFSIGGVQVNPDGCVVAKGFDEEGILFRIREQMKGQISFLPPRQSGWAHVPLGRILEPLGTEKFNKLKLLISTMSNSLIATTKIKSIKLVHEKRWYMEEKTILAEYPLNNNSGEQA
jgi:hypothetical protein